jgi:hypothetical protein
MTALCWGCEVGVNAVGTATNNPVGACWECHVFGCLGHGERDTGSGKWLCFPSVATAAAASAGLPGVASTTRFESSDDLHSRFPRIVEAAGVTRTPADLAGIFQQRVRTAQGDVDFVLLAMAANIGSYVLRAITPRLTAIDRHTDQILPAALLALLIEG